MNNTDMMRFRLSVNAYKLPRLYAELLDTPPQHRLDVIYRHLMCSSEVPDEIVTQASTPIDASSAKAVRNEENEAKGAAILQFISDYERSHPL